jgi:FixJ family two-component response regulator
MVKLQFDLNAAKFGRLLAMLLDNTIESTEYSKLYATLSKEERDLYGEIVDGLHTQGITEYEPL